MALGGRFTVMSEDEMIETTAQALARQFRAAWSCTAKAPRQ